MGLPKKEKDNIDDLVREVQSDQEEEEKKFHSVAHDSIDRSRKTSF